MLKKAAVLGLCVAACAGEKPLSVGAPHSKPTARIAVPAEKAMRLPPPQKIATLTKEGGQVRTSIPVAFEGTSSNVSSAMSEALGEVVVFLLSHPEVTRLRIEGHTDAASSATLADDRANAVTDVLVANGVSRERLISVSCGHLKPAMVEVNSRVERVTNRVDFFVAETNGKPLFGMDEAGGCQVIRTMTTGAPVVGSSTSQAGFTLRP